LRATTTAAAAPNSNTIGGAGTGVGPPELDVLECPPVLLQPLLVLQPLEPLEPWLDEP
jgi:hypothetical protein